MDKNFTIVTAIPYVNSVPHIGTSLDLLGADVCARYHRSRGAKVWFLAGTDENGLKVREAAEAAGQDPMAFVDMVSGRFRDVWAGLKCEYDEWIRTTEERHKRATQEFFTILQDKGYIYRADYEGWYDVNSETYFRESELVDGKSPDGNEVRWVKESNYFFKLSAFQDQLLKHIEDNPEFIVPDVRRNEVLAFIKQGLRDACISRSNPGWGIPVPGDESQVVYVWFDAVINYVSGGGWPDQQDWRTKWPADIQWLGKDILPRFHATIWPAMLLGVGLPLPKRLVVHAWVLKGEEKISKSKGNTVAPLALAADLAARAQCDPEIAIDVVRYQMVATMPYETDFSFTYQDFDRRYNADLANDLGNSLNRTLAMSHKFVAGRIPDSEPEGSALQAIESARKDYEAAMSDVRLDRAAQAAWSVVRFLNKYIDTRAPWALAKNGDPALPSVMRSMLLCLRSVEVMVRPIMPVAADAIAGQLNLPPLVEWSQIGAPGSLPPGVELGQPKPIFPRLQAEAPEPQAEAPKPKEKTPTVSEIGIEDFMKVQLRVARVVEAEAVEGSDKLLKLQVAIGDETRQIVAGIRQAYQPIDLIGRQIVVVANLKPANLRGVESRGMLLAAVDEHGRAILLQPDREAPEGSQVR